MVSADRLASLYQVAFDHDAFDKPADIFIDPAAVQDLFYNADLLFILFAGIRMIGIDEDRRVLQISLSIFFQKELDILGSHLSPYAYPFVIENMMKGNLKTDGVVSSMFKIEEWEKAFDYASGKYGDFKVAFKFD